jgi:hypothetical protein
VAVRGSGIISGHRNFGMVVGGGLAVGGVTMVCLGDGGIVGATGSRWTVGGVGGMELWACNNEEVEEVAE